MKLAAKHRVEGSMGEIIQFKRPDGKACPGYLATPKTGLSAPGYVVIQAWWGLNGQIKKTADHAQSAKS